MQVMIVQGHNFIFIETLESTLNSMSTTHKAWNLDIYISRKLSNDHWVM